MALSSVPCAYPQITAPLPAAIAACFHHIHGYLASPYQFSPHLNTPNDLLNSLPMLLRYCDDGLKRWQKLDTFSSRVSMSCLVLGDALMLFYPSLPEPQQSLFSPFQACQSQLLDVGTLWQSVLSQADAQAVRYGLSSEQAHYYLGLWNAISVLS
ncbi:MAG: hypothetical protein AAFU53_13380, partial [Cyanobacteria bacterium J06632_3]